MLRVVNKTPSQKGHFARLPFPLSPDTGSLRSGDDNGLALPVRQQFREAIKLFRVLPLSHFGCLAGWRVRPLLFRFSLNEPAKRVPTLHRVAHPRALFVQFHDILYKVSRDILYTPARAKRTREYKRGCHGRRWMSESSG